MNMNQQLWEKETVELFRVSLDNISLWPLQCIRLTAAEIFPLEDTLDFFENLLKKYSNAAISTFPKLQIPYTQH